MDRKHPTKEQGREWLSERAKERKPLPDISTIRREMGMDLIEAEKQANERAGIRSGVEQSGSSSAS